MLGLGVEGWYGRRGERVVLWVSWGEGGGGHGAA